MKSIAKKYIDSGLSCLPVKDNKAPAVSSWRGVEIPVDEFTAHGIGIKCGADSGGLECLDFDNHFGDAKKTLSEFVKQINDLYKKHNFPIQSTQSGGYHLLYRCGNVGGNQKLASKPKQSNGKWIPDAIIETRGEGGYFVAAPTKGYKVIRNSITDIPIIETSERDELINIARSFNQWSEPVKVPEYESKEKPGDYYNSQPDAKQDMIDCLRSNGWTQLGTYQWQRPDKKKGVSATLGKVADNIFYNFSSNAHPFDEMKGYTPFQVVSLLKFNGNFKECASWIAEKYNLKTVNDYHKPQKKQKEPEINYGHLLVDCFVNTDIEVDKPPVVMEINHSDGVADYHRIMTLGNFSAIIGKSKSKN